MKNVTEYFNTPEMAPTDDSVSALREIIAMGEFIQAKDILTSLDARFRYILDRHGRCEMNANDDKWMAMVMQNVDRNTVIWSNAFMAAEIKIRPYVTKIIKELKVEAQDWEDCYSEVRGVLLEKIGEYDSEIATLVTYLSPHIRHVLYGKRNNNSRYTSTLIKLSLKAKDALAEMGKPINAVTISEYINTVTPLSRRVSPKQVENAMEYNKYSVDLNENVVGTSEVKSPESSYLEKEYAEELRNVCDRENWAVKTMFDIFKEYYLSDNPEEFEFEDDGKCIDGYRKKLPESYLRKEMKKRTGIDFSEDKLNGIIATMSDAIRAHGFGHRAKNNSIFVQKKKINDTSITAEEIDMIFDDVMASATF